MSMGPCPQKAKELQVAELFKDWAPGSGRVPLWMAQYKNQVQKQCLDPGPLPSNLSLLGYETEIPDLSGALFPLLYHKGKTARTVRVGKNTQF